MRGRGGAGFPTWRKWKLTRQAAGEREVRRLQRRRGRPRRLHGPQRAGGRSAQRHRGHGHRRRHDRRLAGLRLRPGRISAGRRAAEDRHGAGPGARPAGQEHPRQRLRLRAGNPHGLRGVRLRRRDGPDDLDRGQPRRAAPPAAVPRPEGPLGQAHAAEQRRDLRQRPGHHPEAAALVRPARHRKEQGHQGLRPGRGDQERRPGRSARRHAAGRPDLRHRRRDPGRQGVQGGADRRPLRRLHPQAAPQRAAGLRVARRAGRDHGLRRPDRHGRRQLHGGRRPLLPRIRPGRIVRQVRALPRGHEADAGDPQPHLRGPRRRGRRRAARSSWAR